MRKRIRSAAVVVAALALLAVLGAALAFAENIDHGWQYAWGENVGWLNAEPGGEGMWGIEVGNTELTGYMWGENIGWINLSCQNNAACDGAAGDWGVTNDNGGNLAGYAWGENVGWISFSCRNSPSTCASTGYYGVTINPTTGVFSGYAWGENIGWISFSDDAPWPYGVKTSWSSPCTAGVDSDGDTFKDEIEWYLPSDCLDNCTNNPGVHDAWPLDVSMNKVITVVGDVLPYSGRIGATGGPPASPNWRQRLDLNKDNRLTVVGDVLKFAGKIGMTCT
jgi:hypothetical protein